MFTSILEEYRNSLDTIVKNDSFRKQFLRFNRFATFTFIVIVTLYSLYLKLTDKLMLLNFGSAWWITLLLLSTGWIGEVLIALRTTKLHKALLIKGTELVETIFQEFHLTYFHRIPPYIEVAQEKKEIQNS